MSNREKLRERIFGILYTLFGSLMFIVGLTTGSSKALLGGFAFLIIGSFSWIKLAMHSNPKKKENSRPVKQNAAHMAREREMEELKAKQAQARQEHDALCVPSPTPLQIRQWNNVFKWDWKHDKHPLIQTLYIYRMTSNALGVTHLSRGSGNLCVLQNKNGIWYLSNVGYNTTVRMNPPIVREKCQGMPVNTQEFPVARGEETPLAPGDCFSVFQDQLFLHFRVDELQPDSNNS